ncbi:hypothetical protein GOV11_02685 [Candidatus Woesearchaeota archaeon]|nr:hypothetical protein [Candidatus Woesearchaeota archaeon]
MNSRPSLIAGAASAAFFFFLAFLGMPWESPQELLTMFCYMFGLLGLPTMMLAHSLRKQPNWWAYTLFYWFAIVVVFYALRKSIALL